MSQEMEIVPSGPIFWSTIMSMSIDTLTAAALSLPPDQRFELAQRLWESVEGQLDEDEELFAEIECRGVGKSIELRVPIGERIDVDRIDRRDSDVTNTGDVTSLPGPHPPHFPQADRLRLSSPPNRIEKFSFE